VQIVVEVDLGWVCFSEQLHKVSEYFGINPVVLYLAINVNILTLIVECQPSAAALHIDMIADIPDR
jgi:hypothetical protein